MFFGEIGDYVSSVADVPRTARGAVFVICKPALQGSVETYRATLEYSTEDYDTYVVVSLVLPT